jgi:hypothetical protein
MRRSQKRYQSWRLTRSVDRASTALVDDFPRGCVAGEMILRFILFRDGGVYARRRAFRSREVAKRIGGCKWI